ncbi:Glycosyltransferase involved in cell wall bisynthesis [Mucilaginibacter gossypiicola]|uniref:Glycosyltransferase involved in cell wall bisynthesis n=1 Tax=Mucilaginibacter gossypiicola TaxID=551995 RepID=A0A1H8N3C5_9SPHI|nr:glycosyltransferase family 4 protein [Mucilaginibacter gossypiicola]SEO24145.1 Glycosyltransferase involved in cell wall bisynthesis [Mucilaginibacter gossypiicola]
MAKKVILFTLQTFSTTGGIQKMTRTLGHSLHRASKINKWDFELWSAYDKQHDLMEQYLPAANFKAFGINRINFVLKTAGNTANPDVAILSHINLAVIGLIIKFINPKCRLWLVAHGIEVWRPLSFLQRLMLKRCDNVICVSNYTKQQMISRHNLNAGKCIVLNNAIDPFMRLPNTFAKPQNLLKRYGLNDDDFILFSLTRLASTEQYKGYDHVISVLESLKSKFPQIKYVLSGKYDSQEYIRIKKMITEHNVSDNVILTGFINEAELTEHFLLADLFVLPSKKEGFGIVFIEALACGLPVICGNADGSIDAIRNGELGEAIDPDNLNELNEAIIRHMQKHITADSRKNLQKKCVSHFNEHDYMTKLEQLINE